MSMKSLTFLFIVLSTTLATANSFDIDLAVEFQPGKQPGVTYTYLKADEILRALSQNESAKVFAQTDSAAPQPLYRVDYATSGKGRCQERPLRILVTAGIHGNEPVGVVTAFDLMKLLKYSKTDINANWTILPLLNPEGLAKRTRMMHDQSNLNRAFEDLNKPVPLAIARTLNDTQYDLSIDLHGSNRRKQFFLIKGKEDSGVGLAALQVLSKEKLLHTKQGLETGYIEAPVDGKDETDEHRYLLEAAGLSISSNVGTMKDFMVKKGTAYSYTLEYPGSIPFAESRPLNLVLLMSLIDETAKAICR